MGLKFRVGLLGMALATFSLRAWAEEPPSEAGKSLATNAAPIQLKGQLVPQTNTTPGGVSFQAESGRIYTLLSNDNTTALFTGSNLLGRTLLLKGRPAPGSNRFEVTGNLRSLHGSNVHDLFFYCDICAIKTSYAGACMCCREPVRLMETPVGEEP